MRQWPAHYDNIYSVLLVNDDDLGDCHSLLQLCLGLQPTSRPMQITSCTRVQHMYSSQIVRIMNTITYLPITKCISTPRFVSDVQTDLEVISR